MKKLTLMAALAVAAGLTSCTAQSPKASMETDVDSLTYAIGLVRTQGLDQFLMQQGIDSTRMSAFLKGFKEGTQKNDIEDQAYITGMQIGQMVSTRWVEDINNQLFAGDSTKTINQELMIAGFLAGTLKENQEMEMAVASDYIRRNLEKVRERSLETLYADNKAAGEKFLEENKTKEGVVTTESGLQYKIITKGNGAIPTKSSRVKVNYKGTLIDGTEFDSSYKLKDKDGNPRPATFLPTQVIKGWSEALTMMPVGSKWELYIPYDLAYGSKDSGVIKPYSTLIFEVELVDIENNKK